MTTRRTLLAVSAMATVVAVAVVWNRVDPGTLGAVIEGVRADLLWVLLALASFALSFALRAWAWCRLLPGLPFAQSLAAIHVALGANHVLPLRLGEPLRIVSVLRRTPIRVAPATATTITLRSADLLAVLAVTTVAGATVVGTGSVPWLDSWGFRLAAVVLGIMLAGGLVWTVRLRVSGAVRLPGPAVVAAVAVAWVAESGLMLVVANGAGVDLSLAGAVFVSSAAVAAQLAAITPGGLGTYEAGAVAAFTALGVDPASALSVALVTHALKTVYSVVAGTIGVFAPQPGFIGMLRLPRLPTRTREPEPTVPHGPVVLFMPAHNEQESVAGVMSRVPGAVLGHPVVPMVIDDGSTDDTRTRAERAGAVVVAHDVNRGLGAAVATGLGAALALDPVAVAFCDADGEYAPEELEGLIAPILRGGADYVVGSRFAGSIARMHPHRRLGNVVLTRWVAFVTRLPITDGQSGYRAFSPGAAAAAEIAHDFNYAQVLTIDLVRKGFGYAEVPISYSFRTSGESFIRLGQYLRAVVPAVHRELNADVRSGPAPTLALRRTDRS